jgi:biotin transport system permease protein
MGQAALGLASAARLIAMALLGVSLTLTTRHTELLEVFEWVLAPMARLGVPVNRLSLLLALMMRFIEHFFLQWKRLDDAYRVRTGRTGGWRLLAPLTIQMLVTARRVADTLHARLGR